MQGRLGTEWRRAGVVHEPVCFFRELKCCCCTVTGSVTPTSAWTTQTAAHSLRTQRSGLSRVFYFVPNSQPSSAIYYCSERGTNGAPSTDAWCRTGCKLTRARSWRNAPSTARPVVSTRSRNTVDRCVLTSHPGRCVVRRWCIESAPELCTTLRGFCAPLAPP